MAIRFFVEGRNRARGYGLCGMRNYLGDCILASRQRAGRSYLFLSRCLGRSWMRYVTPENIVAS